MISFIFINIKASTYVYFYNFTIYYISFLYFASGVFQSSISTITIY
jgi:hypothetical protein